MMSRDIGNYPPVGDPDRLDQIMQRGASMRRKRRVLGASSAGIMGIAALALVFALGRGTEPATQKVATSPDGGTTQEQPDRVPDDDSEPTTPPTTIRSEDLPFVSFSINDDVREMSIIINDAEMPVPADPSLVTDSSFMIQQCVLVGVSDVDDPDGRSFEGHACRRVIPGDDSPVLQTPFELTDATEVAIGCAAIDERLDQPIDMTSTSATTEFTTSVAGLGGTSGSAGRYRVTITAVSGFGDGCPAGTDGQDPDSPQHENVDTITATFELGS